jgi:hypothetical protein
VVTRILPPSMRSNTTDTLSAFSNISRVSMGGPGSPPGVRLIG